MLPQLTSSMQIPLTNSDTVDFLPFNLVHRSLFRQNFSFYQSTFFCLFFLFCCAFTVRTPKPVVRTLSLSVFQDILFMACNPISPVQRIVIFKRHGIMAMVEYPDSVGLLVVTVIMSSDDVTCTVPHHGCLSLTSC